MMNLLKHFYADVRQHAVIGPIFNEQIKDWNRHLELIGDFWTTVSGGTPSYSGQMPAKHMPLGLKEEHFQAWLGLWEHNCRIYLTEDCALEMLTFARHIALRLRMLCGVPVPAENLREAMALPVRNYGRKPEMQTL